MNLKIQPFVAPVFGQNTYAIWRDDRTDAVIIDPGNCIPDLLRTLAQYERRVAAILLTHAHIDHIEGIAPLLRAMPAPIHLHPGDRAFYDRVAIQAAQFGMQVETPPAPDHDLSHGQRVDVAGISFSVRHVPGHSPGHVLFHVADAACAFVGDIIFQGSIGRTDLPGGDFAQLIGGIRTEVLTLPDDTTLYSGHGPATTVRRERATNPFLTAQFGGGLA